MKRDKTLLYATMTAIFEIIAVIYPFTLFADVPLAITGLFYDTSGERM
jgi:hypothetical protein